MELKIAIRNRSYIEEAAKDEFNDNDGDKI